MYITHDTILWIGFSHPQGNGCKHSSHFDGGWLLNGGLPEIGIILNRNLSYILKQTPLKSFANYHFRNHINTLSRTTVLSIQKIKISTNHWDKVLPIQLYSKNAIKYAKYSSYSIQGISPAPSPNDSYIVGA